MYWNIKLPRFLLIGALLFLMVSCFSDDEYEDVIIIRPDPKEIVNASVSGLVLDENNRPLSNAQVSLYVAEGVVTQTTDEQGYFLFIHQSIPESAYLVVDHGNKFTGRRRIPVSAEQIVFVEMKLTERQIKGSFEAKEGGKVVLDNLSSVSVPANCVEDENGSPYDGTVNVMFHKVDPYHAEFHKKLIGDLSGLDEKGSTKALVSIGMFTLELYDTQGRQLEFGKNCNASLSFVTKFQENIPTVPIWSFNEETGTWTEQGVAAMQFFPGDNLPLSEVIFDNLFRTGTWNFDYKENPINISGKIRLNVDDQVQFAPVGFLKVSISSDQLGFRAGYVMSDQSFLFTGFPAGHTFELMVEDECGRVLFSAPFGPFDADQILADMDLVFNEKPTLVSGFVVDCEDATIENGIIQSLYQSGKKYFNVFRDGAFSVILDEQFDCDQSEGVELEIIDRSTNLTYHSNLISLNESAFLLDTIKSCDLPSEYIEYKIDGENYVLCPGPEINLSPIGENSSFGCGDFIVTIPDLVSIGNYSDSVFLNIIVGGNFYDHVDPKNLNIEVTDFGAASNDVFAGLISGQVRKVLGGGAFGNPVNINGSFRIVVD